MKFKKERLENDGQPWNKNDYVAVTIPTQSRQLFHR